TRFGERHIRPAQEASFGRTWKVCISWKPQADCYQLLCFLRYLDDFPYKPHTNIWDNTRQSGFGEAKVYVVQTANVVIERCLLMTTDPGDLVLDPTCGSGTTAYVAEQWGRRWITTDTSRVALALA